MHCIKIKEKYKYAIVNGNELKKYSSKIENQLKLSLFEQIPVTNKQHIFIDQIWYEYVLSQCVATTRMATWKQRPELRGLVEGQSRVITAILANTLQVPSNTIPQLTYADHQSDLMSSTHQKRNETYDHRVFCDAHVPRSTTTLPTAHLLYLTSQ